MTPSHIAEVEGMRVTDDLVVVQKGPISRLCRCPSIADGQCRLPMDSATHGNTKTLSFTRLPFSATHLGLQRAEENGETPCPAVGCGTGSNKQLVVMLIYEPLRRLNISNEFAIEIVVQISISPLSSLAGLHSVMMLILVSVRGGLPLRWVGPNLWKRSIIPLLFHEFDLRGALALQAIVAIHLALFPLRTLSRRNLSRLRRVCSRLARGQLPLGYA